MSYWTRYEDGRDAIDKIYSDLDLSCIAIPDSDGEDAEEEHESAEVAPTEDAPIEEASIEQASTIAKPTPASEGTALDPPLTSEELAAMVAIIDAIAVEDFNH